MDIVDVAFPYRILLLAVVFGVLALLQRRSDPSRWREYAFVFAAGCLGGSIGVVNDLVTSTLSPAYFEIAKGIGGGDGFVGRVVGLGFHAGFVAGASTACVYLYATNPGPNVARVGYSVLCRLMVRPISAALAFACLLGIGSLFVQPHPFVRGMGFLVPVQYARAFLAVAAIHTGLYAGLVIGVASSVRSIRRR